MPPSHRTLLRLLCLCLAAAVLAPAALAVPAPAGRGQAVSPTGQGPASTPGPDPPPRPIFTPGPVFSPEQLKKLQGEVEDFVSSSDQPTMETFKDDIRLFLELAHGILTAYDQAYKAGRDTFLPFQEHFSPLWDRLRDVYLQYTSAAKKLGTIHRALLKQGVSPFLKKPETTEKDVLNRGVSPLLKDFGTLEILRTNAFAQLTVPPVVRPPQPRSPVVRPPQLRLPSDGKGGRGRFDGKTGSLLHGNGDLSEQEALEQAMRESMSGHTGGGTPRAFDGKMDTHGYGHGDLNAGMKYEDAMEWAMRESQGQTGGHHYSPPSSPTTSWSSSPWRNLPPPPLSPYLRAAPSQPPSTFASSGPRSGSSTVGSPPSSGPRSGSSMVGSFSSDGLVTMSLRPPSGPGVPSETPSPAETLITMFVDQADKAEGKGDFAHMMTSLNEAVLYIQNGMSEKQKLSASQIQRYEDLWARLKAVQQKALGALFHPEKHGLNSVFWYKLLDDEM